MSIAGRRAAAAPRLLALITMVAIAALAACLDPGPACGDGVCPSGTVCTAVGERCVYPEQLEVCLGIVDDTTCTIRGDRDGVCRGQVCMPIVCGDGIAQGGEECDRADLGGIADCLGLADGYHQVGALACRADCSYDRTACGPRCGDGIVQPELEACDGPPVARTCTTEGFYGGTLACSASCGLDITACEGECGDRRLTANERCDGPDVGDHSCTTERFYGGVLACNATCDAFDVSACTGSCGDGEKNGPEICDTTDLAGLSCQTYGFHGGSLACGADCVSVDRSACIGYCGDGIRNGTEQCDGLDQGGESCTSVGARMGALGCNAFCQPTLDQCYWAQLRSVDTEAAYALDLTWGTGSDDIWIAGGDGLVEHFDGERWSPVATGARQRIIQIWGTSADDVWALALNNELFHFDGTTWSRVFSVLGSKSTAWASGIDDLWIGDPTGVLPLRHHDGVRWLEFRFTDGAVAAIHGTDRGDTWAAFVSGGLRHYDGRAWTVHSLPGNGGRWIWAASSRDVWAVRRHADTDNSVHHFDGLGWQTIATDGVGNPLQVWTDRQRRVWLRGSDGSGDSIYRYEAGRWRKVVSSAVALTSTWSAENGELWLIETNRLRHLDGPDWEAHDMAPTATVSRLSASDTAVWAVADRRLHVSDGRGWIAVADAPPIVRDVWADAVEVWVGGDDAMHRLLERRWESFPAPAAVWSLWASGRHDLWAAAGIDVLHWDGGRWSSTGSDVTAGGFAHIAGVGPGDVWALGRDRRQMFHHDGHAWSERRSLPTVVDLLHPTTSDDVWLLGRTVLHDDGASLRTDRLQMARNFTSAWSLGPRDVWAVSTDGLIHHHDGVTWSPVTTPVHEVFTTGDITSDAVWMAGGHGRVVRLRRTRQHSEPGTCAAPLRAYCNVSLRGHTAQTTDGPADCGAGDHAGGELAYKIEVPVTGRLTARVTSRHDVDLVALGADARGGCDLDACASEDDGTEVELEVRQGDVYYLVVGARDGAAPFTLHVACEKN